MKSYPLRYHGQEKSSSWSEALAWAALISFALVAAMWMVFVEIANQPVKQYPQAETQRRIERNEQYRKLAPCIYSLKQKGSC